MQFPTTTTTYQRTQISPLDERAQPRARSLAGDRTQFDSLTADCRFVSDFSPIGTLASITAGDGAGVGARQGDRKR